MKEIEVFFDYVCPFCNRGIRQFIEILPEYPDVKVIWRPCEAHPRPEHASIHSDLAIQAMFYLQEIGGDLINYHLQVYDAWFRDKKRIDDIEPLSDIAADCGANKAGVQAALQENKYAKAVDDANSYAWDERQLYAVPSYISGDKQALSRNGILVSIRKVKELLD